MKQDKELRYMSRRELIEIIYEMKKQEEKLQARLNKANAALARRELYVKHAGSIAEAALALNEVFEAAQTAADDYVRSVKALYRQEETEETEEAPE